MRRFVVFVPVYHGVVPMLADLLESADQYLGEEFHTIIVDDHTTDRTAVELERLRTLRGPSSMTVLRNERNEGWGFGIYKNFARAARHALEHVDFDVLLKLDHDSLLIAPGVASGFRALLEVPGVGIAGNVQPEVNRWMWDWRTQPAVKREAVKHGYLETLNGFPWSIQAGVMGFNRVLLEALEARGWLERFDFVRFGTNGLVEDVMLPILASALGFRALHAPFVRSTHGSDALLRLPYPQMRQSGLRAIHPVKSGLSSAAQHNASDHEEMRAFFKSVRAEEQRRARLEGAS
jgi:hypothetical protein